MLAFLFWFMIIWMFIGIFADIFRRNDLSGAAKAGWLVLIFVLPFLGILIYMISRPKMTAQDKEMMEQAQEAQRRASGYSAAWSQDLRKAPADRSVGSVARLDEVGVGRRGRGVPVAVTLGSPHGRE